jgi:ADP-L-glycero-D-manno-heptose 6-epimerase
MDKRPTPVLDTTHIVVTGAAGFIGSQLLKALVSQYASINLLAVDHPLRDSRAENLNAAPHVPFLDHNSFVSTLERGLIRPSLIFHLGACSSTTESSWEYLYQNNLQYSQRLWTWCAENGSRLIYASSAATYGNGENGFSDSIPLKKLRPLNLYAKSKHDFDVWVEEQPNKPSQSVGLKFFNVFGPGESHKGRMASMAYHSFGQIRKDGIVRLFKSHRSDYGDGGQLRDFIYVKDVIRVIMAYADKPHISGLFNLGAGKAHSFLELAHYTFEAMNKKPRIEFIPMPEDLQDRYQYFTQATMEKSREAGIIFSPTPLYESILDYMATMAMDGI